MVRVKDITAMIEEIAPLRLAEEWDNCGLILGNEEAKVDKVLISLEATEEVVQYAVDNKIDMIITHHPLIFSKINRITNKTVEGRKILKLISKNINLYSAHTNLDKAKNGLNQLFAEKLNLQKICILDKDADREYKTGFGRIGEMKKTLTLGRLMEELKEILDISSISYVGDLKLPVKKVAIVTGSGISELENAIEDKVDVLITGDIKYHSALYAKENKVALIDAGHFHSEKIVTELIKRILSPIEDKIEILQDTFSKNPIEIF